MMAQDKVMIVAAVNGGMQMDRDGAKVPVTPEEISEDALQCYEAGASILHFHARDAEGRNSAAADIYSEVISLVRKKCPILLQTTNGVGVRRDPVTGSLIWPSDAERLALLNLDPSPDLYGIAAGSTDFFHPAGGYMEEVPYVNSIEYLRQTLPVVFERGSTIEFEITDINVPNRLLRLANMGVFDANADNLWFLHAAGLGNKPATARNMVYATDEMRRHFPNAKWGVLGAGVHNFKLAAIGIGMGCNTVRIGFEDSLHRPDGSIARRNRELVEAMVDLVRATGREVGTPDDARKMFGLRN
jgi:3-keto-5-aminohexanoate cleavage enzyme